jgi:acyl-phosphate glycerol 3-phosphate acyltransferase
VDLFAAGSGNIGATNAGRVLGRGYGLLVFVLDFLKGAGPVAAAGWLGAGDGLRALTAAAAFLGHLFPVTLGFRGGKGVATGLGVVMVLVPGPAAATFAAWGLVTLLTRYVSLASVLAVVVLLAGTVAVGAAWPVLLFVAVGGLFVVAKHRGNLRRLLAGTESRIGDGPMRQTLLRVVHLIALGLWAGGAGFFTFLAAPAMNAEFAEVVATAPNTRTSNRPLLPADATEADKKELASALFGAAVGPVFPWLFAVQAVGSVLALATAAAWWPLGGIHRRRVVVLAVAAAVGAVGLWLSAVVTELRPKRFDPDPAVAAAAKRDFGPWHLTSLAATGLTVVLAGVGLGMAARLPTDS